MVLSSKWKGELRQIEQKIDDNYYTNSFKNTKSSHALIY